MFRQITTIFVIIILSFSLGCSKSSSTPKQVANQLSQHITSVPGQMTMEQNLQMKTMAASFWESTKKGSYKALFPHITQADVNALNQEPSDGFTKYQFDSISFGEPVLQGSEATLKTVMDIKGLSMNLVTTLLNDGNQWKVSAEATIMSMMSAIEGIQKIAEESGQATQVIPTPAPTSSYQSGDAVKVKWRNSWWRAHVLKSEGSKWYITYDGYSSSWNEWVGSSRIRPR